MKQPQTELEKKIQRLVDHHAIFDFPEFLQIMRIVHRMTKTEVCSAIGIDMMRLFHFEVGAFKKLMHENEAHLLEGFYGLPDDLLMLKCTRYIADGKCTPQKFGRKKLDHPKAK
jgi:hypothetical protein